MVTYTYNWYTYTSTFTFLGSIILKLFVCYDGNIMAIFKIK